MTSELLSPTQQKYPNALVSNRQSRSERFDRAFKLLIYSMAGTIVGILILMAWVIFQRALPAIDKFGWGFLVGREWNVPDNLYGAMPLIYGTLMSSTIALIFAIPIGISIAVVTSENLLPKWLRVTVAFTIELIAAIPSVIFGLWGFYTLVPNVLQPLQKFLHAKFGWLPFFATEPSGFGMLTAGVLLAIMILPTMAAVSREVLLVVPNPLRTGSMALGCTRWETILNVVLPTAFSGIVSAVMLALGRALGETMAVTMVIGNATTLSLSLLEPAYSIPAILANQFNEAQDDIHIGALSFLALILFALTLIVNIGAVGIVRWVESRVKN
jgi:phosphate transport system permease protein